MNVCPNADNYGLCACGPDCYYLAMLAAGPQTGWLCPRCGTGNSPTVLQCPCATTMTTYGSTHIDPPLLVSPP